MALTRGVSPNLGACELEYLSRRDIDVARARDQHRLYQDCLVELGAQIVAMPADPNLPDGVFVEDPAVVVDEIAVISRMGAEARRKETETIAEALGRFRKLEWLKEPATLDGGDVMRIGKTLYVGVSRRTNPAGIGQLGALLEPFAYRVIPVAVRGCLHMKSGCCDLGDGAILANREWIDCSAFDGLRVIDVAAEEPWSANILRIGDTVLFRAGSPKTRRIVEDAGFQIRELDTSELAKAEGSLTCMSILFES